MDFMTKKIISSLLLPLPISLFFFLIGFIFLCTGRAKKWGISLGLLGIILLWLFSTAFFPKYLLDHLESKFKPLKIAPNNVKSIVVLGGGVRVSSRFPANTQLNSASLSRLIEGIRLYQQLRKKDVNVKLLLSGGRIFNAPSEAGQMHNTAVTLGVSKNDILIEDGSTNTYQEANFLKPILGKKTFILVTSAAHMPRAMAIFRKLNMQPIAAPTQFLSKEHYPLFSYFIPSALNLIYADIALHEYFGFVWGKLKNHL